MNDYLVIIWDGTQDPPKVIYQTVEAAASAADAKAACAELEDRRPGYTASTIKMN